MEKYYPPENFNATENVPLKSYFETFSTNIVNVQKPDATNQIKSIMNMDCDSIDWDQLESNCSSDQLFEEDDWSSEWPVNNTEDYRELSNRMKTSGVDFEGPLKMQQVYTKSKEGRAKQWFKNSYARMLDHPMPKCKGKSSLKPGTDFLVKILIFRPFQLRYSTETSQANHSSKLRCSQEIIALGTNNLAEIRDKIICNTDQMSCNDVPDTKTDNYRVCKDEYPSGCMYIDNCFYNDLRASNQIDYSVATSKWLTEKTSTVVKTAKMHETRLDALQPRFSYPYVYLHQGDCEHILVFADARLLQRHDNLRAAIYPYVSRYADTKNRHCQICNSVYAEWIVKDSERMPHEKMLLCTTCCDSYNYTDGKKVGTFQLFPYRSAVQRK